MLAPKNGKNEKPFLMSGNGTADLLAMSGSPGAAVNVKQSAADMFELSGPAHAALPPTTRQELMDLSRRLRAVADSIDAITDKRPKKAVDENGEPTFRFAAKVSLPDDFRITKKLQAYAAKAGFSQDKIDRLHETFVTYYRKEGRKWKDWGSVWMEWVRREKDRIATAPKQRASSGQLERW